MDKEYLEKLANDHWEYVQALLHIHEEGTESSYAINVAKFHYKSAFIHGYKHALEDEENK